MTKRLPQLAPGDLDRAQRELYDAIIGGPRGQGPQAFALVDGEGHLAGPFNAMLLNPTVGTALQALGAACRYGTTLSGRCRELAILVVAHYWRSEFEIDAHEAVGATVGLTSHELALLAAGRSSELEDPVERMVASIAETLVAQGDLTDADYAAAVASLGTSVIFEITSIVGYYATLALQLRVFGVGRR